MRGRYRLWYRVRVNLEHVAASERPAQEPLEMNYDPWSQFRGRIPDGRAERP
jgi:bifunctional non-homologous end joining protein LigD